MDVCTIHFFAAIELLRVYLRAVGRALIGKSRLQAHRVQSRKKRHWGWGHTGSCGAVLWKAIVFPDLWWGLRALGCCRSALGSFVVRADLNAASDAGNAVVPIRAEAWPKAGLRWPTTIAANHQPQGQRKTLSLSLPIALSSTRLREVAARIVLLKAFRALNKERIASHWYTNRDAQMSTETFKGTSHCQ